MTDAKHVREARGLTMQEVAVYADVSVASVRAFERGAAMKVRTKRRLEAVYRGIEIGTIGHVHEIDPLLVETARVWTRPTDVPAVPTEDVDAFLRRARGGRP